MKLNQFSQAAGFLAVFASIALVQCSVFADLSRPPAVQIDLGPLLNARVVFTQKDGRLQPADHSLDCGDSSVLITKSAAVISKAGQLNCLPDSGFFVANREHPDVQLAYGTAGDGPQVYQTTATTKTCSIPVPAHHYAQLQLFFISAQGPTPISVKLSYTDGSSDERTTIVPDFYWLLKETDKGWFVLTGDFGKVNLKGRMTESVHHFIHGFNLDPDPAKVLRSVEITKKNSGSVLNLFGATGQLKNF